MTRSITKSWDAPLPERQPLLLRSLAGVVHGYTHCARWDCDTLPTRVSILYWDPTDAAHSLSFPLCRFHAREAIDRERAARWDGRYHLAQAPQGKH